MADALRPADSHDLIRVQGARENNLKDVSVDVPKRRLTVFTGVSGSGKSSLVFDTIAAESRRMIDETYSAFVQGFMPSVPRPDVDVLEGLTTAIIVDQERLGANPRSTVGTVTDANAMLRILFSKLGDPYIGGPTAFSFNIPTQKASGVMTGPGGEKKIVKDAIYLGGMCPRCEGRGAVSDLDLAQIVDESKSLDEGAIMVPGYTADGWMVKGFSQSGFYPADKPIEQFTEKQRHLFLYGEVTKVKISGINMTYEGLIPKITKSMLSKDIDALQPPHPRFRGTGGVLHHLSRVRRHAPDRGSAVVEDLWDQHRRRVPDAGHRPRRLGERARPARGGTAAGRSEGEPRRLRDARTGLPEP